MHNPVLEEYTKSDVLPFQTTITNNFNAFYENFTLDPQNYLTLPSMAMAAAYATYPDDTSLLFTLNKVNEEITKLMRANVFGGITIRVLFSLISLPLHFIKQSEKLWERKNGGL